MRPALVLLPCVLLALACPAAAAPDEELLGKSEGYPIGTRANWFFDERVRVGSFSHLDNILPHYTLAKAATPLPLPKAAGAPKIEYSFENKTLALDDFLAHQRVTGFLLIKDGKVLDERYQYDRNSGNRFISHSMAKSIVSIAIGMALAEKRINSLDDTVSKYVPQLAGSPYGETAIRNLLRMSSGVPFSEDYDGKDDLTRFVIARNTSGSIEALRVVHDTRNGAGKALSLRLQRDRGPDGIVAGRYRHHTHRISDAAAMAADGRRGRRNLGQVRRWYRGRIGKLQCDPARLRTSWNAAGG